MKKSLDDFNLTFEDVEFFEPGAYIICTGTNSRSTNALVGKVFQIEGAFMTNEPCLFISHDDCHLYNGTSAKFRLANDWEKALKGISTIYQDYDNPEIFGVTTEPYVPE